MLFVAVATGFLAAEFAGVLGAGFFALLDGLLGVVFADVFAMGFVATDTS